MTNKDPTALLKQEFKIEHYPQKTVVSLWLDEYDNLFSDFDPRSFSQRVVSDDFLHEAQKVVPDASSGPMQLTLLIPHSKKDIAAEKIITSRLHSFFVKKCAYFEKEVKKIVQKGIKVSLLGIVLIFFATLFSDIEHTSLFYTFLRVLLEPSGWFAVWYGLDHIFYLSKENKGLHFFYKRLEKAQIVFDVY